MPKVIQYKKLDESVDQENRDLILNSFMQDVDLKFAGLVLPSVIELSFTTRNDYSSPNFGFDIIRVKDARLTLVLSQIQTQPGVSIKVPVYMSWRKESDEFIIDYIAGLSANTTYRLKVVVL
jgi:hypothetical protein